MQQNIPGQGESNRRPTNTHTYTHEKCYETFCAVKLVRACIYSPSSVIVACGRVSRAQPSALAFTLCQSLSCPSSPSVSNTRLFLSESLCLCGSGALSCCSRLRLFSPLFPTAFGCVNVPAIGRHFLINIHSPPPQPQPPAAYCVCLNANQFLWNFHWPTYGFRATAPSLNSSTHLLWCSFLILASSFLSLSFPVHIFPFLFFFLYSFLFPIFPFLLLSSSFLLFQLISLISSSFLSYTLLSSHFLSVNFLSSLLSTLLSHPPLSSSYPFSCVFTFSFHCFSPFSALQLVFFLLPLILSLFALSIFTLSFYLSTPPLTVRLLPPLI